MPPVFHCRIMTFNGQCINISGYSRLDIFRKIYFHYIIARRIVSKKEADYGYKDSGIGHTGGM